MRTEQSPSTQETPCHPRAWTSLRVDVVHLRSGEPAEASAPIDGERDAVAVRVRLRHVMRETSTIRAKTNARMESRTRQRVLQRLEHEHARALAHDETVAGFVPRRDAFVGSSLRLDIALTAQKPPMPGNKDRGVTEARPASNLPAID